MPWRGFVFAAYKTVSLNNNFKYVSRIHYCNVLYFLPSRLKAITIIIFDGTIIILFLTDFIMYYNVLFCLVWCPCVAINVSVQRNGGFLPDIILLTQCYYHRGTRLNTMKKFCICSLWSHINILTFFPLTGGCSVGLHAFNFFFKHAKTTSKSVFHYGNIIRIICTRTTVVHVTRKKRDWLWNYFWHCHTNQGNFWRLNIPVSSIGHPRENPNIYWGQKIANQYDTINIILLINTG